MSNPGMHLPSSQSNYLPSPRQASQHPLLPHPLLATSPPTPPPDTNPPILTLYTTTQEAFPHLPPPLLAIETLHATLRQTPTKTTSELLSHLSHSTTTLLVSLPPNSPEHLATKAATALFQRFVVQTLNQSLSTNQKNAPRRTTSTSTTAQDEQDSFPDQLAHLLATTSTFLQHATNSAALIAEKHAHRLLSPSSSSSSNNKRAGVHITTFTLDGAIATFLRTAASPRGPSSTTTTTTITTPTGTTNPNRRKETTAENPPPPFTLTLLTPSPTTPPPHSLPPNIPTTTAPFTHLAPSLQQTTHILLPSYAILSSGSVYGPPGILTIGIVAKEYGVPVYVIGEEWRCCREFDVGEEQAGREGGEVLPGSYVTGGFVMEGGVFGVGVVGGEGVGWGW